MKKKINQKGGEGVGRKRMGEREYFLFFSSLLFFLRSMKIRPQVFVGTEGKVDLRDESYVWTPKSWSFVKLHEVGNFPICVISILNAI